MESLIPPMILMLIIGGAAGYLAGHIFKRVSGMMLTIGIFAFLIICFVYIGTFDVNFDSIASNIGQFFNVLGPLGLATLASSVPFVASFIAGLFIGYRRY